MNYAYLCIVTWPWGTEGLLFPRPGNVEIANDETMGRADFETAIQHLKEYVEKTKKVADQLDFNGTTIRLVKFQRLEVLAEHVHRA